MRRGVKRPCNTRYQLALPRQAAGPEFSVFCAFRDESTVRTIRHCFSATVVLLGLTASAATAQPDPAEKDEGAVAAPARPDVLRYGPPRPQADIPSEETASSVPNPAVSPALHSLAEQTVRLHPQVKAAEGQIKAAGYDVRGARWLRFPSMTIEALGTTRGSANASQNGTVLNAVIEQPIWAGGRIGAAIDRAKAQLLVQQASLDETARDLTLRVIQAYFDVVGASRRIEVLDDALEQHQELATTIKRRVDQEISPRSDLDLARARGAQAQQQLALAQAQRGAGLSAIVELTGSEAVAVGSMAPYDPAIHHPGRDGALEKATMCDPRSARFSAQAIVARAEQRSAKAALMPQLVGQVSSNEVLGERVGIALRAQTGNGLSQAAAAQGASQRALASQEAIAGAQRELREALRLDLVNNAAARDRISSAGVAAASSRFVIDSYKRQFIAGRRTWLDVMNALQETTNNRLAVIEAEATAQVTAARIALRTCAWQPRPLSTETDKSS